MANIVHSEFEERLVSLHAAIDVLRAQLANFKRATGKAAALVDRGEDVVDALAYVDGARLRRELADALRDFEEQRQRTRVAILAMGQEQGSSLSEVGRQLGISRQLASRLAGDGDL